MSVKTKALLAILVAAILWASAGAVAKLLFLTTSPFVVATQRFGLATLILLPFFLRERKPKGFVRDLLPLGCFNAGNILFYYSGLYLSTANTAIILGAAVPLTTAILSPLIIHEHVSKRKIVGIVLGLMGALLVILIPILQHGGSNGGTILGNILLTGSLFSWTLYIIYSRSALSTGTYSPVISTFINVFVVTVSCAIASLITHQPLMAPTMFSASYIFILLFAAIGITVVTFFLFQWAVQHVSASTASLKEYLQLIVGVGINALILGEKVTIVYILGSILIAIGVFIATGEHFSKNLASVLYSQGE